MRSRIRAAYREFESRLTRSERNALAIGQIGVQAGRHAASESSLSFTENESDISLFMSAAVSCARRHWTTPVM